MCAAVRSLPTAAMSSEPDVVSAALGNVVKRFVVLVS
jgi:hypothetical protein